MPFFGSDQIVKAYTVIVDSKQVCAVHGEDRRRLCVRILKRLGEPVNADEQTDSVLTFAADLCRKDIAVSSVCTNSAPAGFDYVVVSVESERSVYLLKGYAVRNSGFKVIEKEYLAQK
jgi:hypothetical protein